VTEILLRAAPEDVIAAIDIKAHRVGLSRTEYLRRALARERDAQSTEVSVADLAGFAGTFDNLGDPAIMSPPGDDRLARRQVCARPIRQSAEVHEWADRIERGLIRITTITRFEVGYRLAPGDFRPALAVARLSSMPWSTSPPRSKTAPSRSNPRSPIGASNVRPRSLTSSLLQRSS
jgi:hypothetical protein